MAWRQPWTTHTWIKWLVGLNLAHNPYLWLADSSLDHAGPEQAGNKVGFDEVEEQQEGKTEQSSATPRPPLCPGQTHSEFEQVLRVWLEYMVPCSHRHWGGPYWEWEHTSHSFSPLWVLLSYCKSLEREQRLLFSFRLALNPRTMLSILWMVSDPLLTVFISSPAMSSPQAHMET